MSTGRSIHAVPSIHRRRVREYKICRRVLKPDQALALFAGLGPVAHTAELASPYPDDDVACGRAVCGPLCGSCGRSPERNDRGTCGSEPPARNTPSRQAGRLIRTTCVRAAGTANAARRGRQPFPPRALPEADTFPRRRAIPIHRPARMTS